MLFLGVGGRGAWIALRRDRRDAESDELTLTDLMRAAAADTVKSVREDMDEMRRRYDERITELSNELREERRHSDDEVARLTRRIAQLERALRRAGAIVPPWEDETPPRGVRT
jgi:hypothetical protein